MGYCGRDTGALSAPQEERTTRAALHQLEVRSRACEVSMDNNTKRLNIACSDVEAQQYCPVWAMTWIGPVVLHELSLRDYS